MTRLWYAFVLGTVALSGNYLSGQTPTQMVEPGAGSWRTWIITSGRDFQVTPPDRAGTAGELTWLREFMRSANDQALAQNGLLGHRSTDFPLGRYALGEG
jgi:hypothetical protein